MIARPNLYSSPGGDTTQIDMTAKHLRLLDIDVTIGLADSINDYESFDLIHFFNIIRPDDILPFTQKSNKPYVISTIYVDYLEYEKNNRKGVLGFLFKTLTGGQIEYAKAIARWLINGDKIKSRYYLIHGHKASIKKVLSKSNLLLPNSHNEYRRLTEYVKRQFNYKKVVNSIDATIFSNDVDRDERYNGHVLCVGRIEGRKNQLNLIKAMLGTNLNLTIIGKPSPNHLGYYEQCRSLAASSNNIHFIEHINHQELVKIYKAAKVHVLPSWFETTGLSSLEAGVMSCNIVVTKKGDTEEYFDDMAYYCDPDKIESIRTQVLAAHADDLNPKLKNYILENYTWSQTAAQTLDGYKEVLNK